MPDDKDLCRKCADTYDREAVESQWHGPDVLFGKMYSQIEAGQSVLDLGIGTGLGSLPFYKLRNPHTDPRHLEDVYQPRLAAKGHGERKQLAVTPTPNTRTGTDGTHLGNGSGSLS